MNPVRSLRRRTGLTQRQLAGRSATSQPTIAAYESGRKSPTVRTLRRLAASCGVAAEVVFVPPLTREDRRSLLIHDALAARVRIEPEAAIDRARRNLVTMRRANPHAVPLLDEWSRILDSGIDRVLDVLADPSEHGRALRHVTPFAGVLDAAERAAVIHRVQAAEAGER